jgi:hypothetical protein
MLYNSTDNTLYTVNSTLGCIDKQTPKEDCGYGAVQIDNELLEIKANIFSQ